MNESFGQRLKKLRKAAGLSQAQLAEACGWKSQSRVGNYETDTREPSFADLQTLADALGKSTHDLMVVSEPIRAVSDPLKARSQESFDANVEPAFHPYKKASAYPVISWIAAGERSQSPEQYVPGSGLAFESDQNAGEYGYWLEVKGGSMTSTTSPTFLPGTYVLVQPEGFDLVSGKYYIAQHRDGETTFKQYVYDAGREYLVPLNPAFETIKMDDDWDVIGRVIDVKITGL
jgi:SOS-response transcriptional repressor LexA